MSDPLASGVPARCPYDMAPQIACRGEDVFTLYVCFVELIL